MIKTNVLKYIILKYALNNIKKNLTKKIQYGGSSNIEYNQLKKKCKKYKKYINELKKEMFNISTTNIILNDDLKKQNEYIKIIELEKNTLIDKINFFNKTFDVVHESIKNNMLKGINMLDKTSLLSKQDIENKNVNVNINFKNNDECDITENNNKENNNK
jgi:hypothetical protein